MPKVFSVAAQRKTSPTLFLRPLIKKRKKTRSIVKGCLTFCTELLSRLLPFVFFLAYTHSRSKFLHPSSEQSCCGVSDGSLTHYASRELWDCYHLNISGRMQTVFSRSPAHTQVLVTEGQCFRSRNTVSETVLPPSLPGRLQTHPQLQSPHQGPKTSNRNQTPKTHLLDFIQAGDKAKWW